MDPPAEPHDPVLLRIGMLGCALVGPAFAVGLPPWAVALAAAAALGLATAWRMPTLLRRLSVPWPMTLGFVALSALVAAAHAAGLLGGVVSLAGTGTGVGDLLRAAGVTAATANVVNNLPAYLALEPAGGDPRRLLAMLIGANCGPLVTPWASLATLLWLQRCRAAGLRWRLWRLALGGLICAMATVGLATAALAAARM